MTDANGLLYMRARYYNPHLRRFLNADPAGMSGGMNWFAYANGDPISYLDPFGLGANEAGAGFWRSAFGTFSSAWDSAQSLNPLYAPMGMARQFNSRYIQSGYLAENGIADTYQTFLGDQLGVTSFAEGRHGVDMISGRQLSGFESGFRQTMGAVQMAAMVLPFLRVGRVAANETVLVRHYTDSATRELINASGHLRSGTFVTLPSQVPGRAGHLRIEQLLEISPGRGSTFIDVPTPMSNLRIPANGATTSGGAWQRQLASPVPVDPRLWRRPPGRPSSGR